MQAPFISFLTTAYRTERYVDETIQSVLAQTRSDWELIVVDNGYSDEMASIVERYTDDSRIRLIRQANSQIRGGVTAAARIAAGQYLCPLNSDDIVKPYFCERMAALIDAYPGIDAVGCDVETFNDPDDGVPPRTYFAAMGRTSPPDPMRKVSVSELLDQGVPPYLGLFRRAVWDAHGGYDPPVDGVEMDVLLWLNIAAAGHDVRLLPQRLARLRMRPDSYSREPSYNEEFESRLQRAYLAVAGDDPVRQAEVANTRMMRRIRYVQALRRARSALLLGDVERARTLARTAYENRHSVRAAAVIVGLRISPRALKALRPVKNQAQKLMLRNWFRLRNAVFR